MSSPQMNPATKDIEQGNKDTNVNDAVDRNKGVGANICCCDTRVASITWFSISLIVETIGLFSIFTNRRVIWWATIIDIAFLIITIIGLVGCAKVKKSMAQAGQVGYIIKAVLCAIGIIAFIAIWGSILSDLLSYYDAESYNTVLGGVLAVAISYFIFMVVGAVVVRKFIKEIDSGTFINSE